MAKGLKLKAIKFWVLIRTFVEVTREKLVRVDPFAPPFWIGLKVIRSVCENSYFILPKYSLVLQLLRLTCFQTSGQLNNTSKKDKS